MLLIFNSVSFYFIFTFIHVFLFFVYFFVFIFFQFVFVFPSVFCFDSYSFKSRFWEIIKYVFLFYSMLIGFFERAGAGVDTDRFACIFS